MAKNKNEQTYLREEYPAVYQDGMRQTQGKHDTHSNDAFGALLVRLSQHHISRKRTAVAVLLHWGKSIVALHFTPAPHPEAVALATMAYLDGIRESIHCYKMARARGKKRCRERNEVSAQQAMRQNYLTSRQMLK